MTDINSIFAVFPVLETPRFVLRAVVPEDAPAIFQIMRNPEVLRYFGRPPMATLAEAAEHVARLDQAFREQEGIRWAIVDRTQDQLIGTCGFWRLIRAHFRAEIGYELAQEWWGQGVMTEALAAMLWVGFAQMGLHSVEAQIHPANIGSRRVLEKLGFVQEGYFRENYYEPAESQFTDTVVFSLLQRDWAQQTAQ